jgi:3-deoxy-D-manno-octulosonate 8-phosphate phosphatase (KDO 8-P phosphatase)
MSDKVFILDVDGVVTDSKMYYTKEGKQMKAFGCDDFDLLRELSKHISVHFITADKKGFSITQKRIEEEMGFELDLVSHDAVERWNWMKEKYPNKKIIFFGDGYADDYALRNCYLGITTKDALQHTKQSAYIVIERSGGDRAAAEACIYLMDQFNIEWRKY